MRCALEPNTPICEKEKPSMVFSSLLFIFYMLVDFLRFFNLIPLTLGNGLYVILGSVGMVYSILRTNIKRQKPVFAFLYVYTLCGIIGISLNGNANPQELLWPFAFLGLATVLLNFRTSYKVSKRSYYFAVVFIALKIFLAGGVDGLDTVSSRNTIGMMMLIYLSLFAISSYHDERRVSSFPVFIGLLVSIMAVGRSGILTFAILLSLFFLFEFNGTRHKVRNPLRWFVVIVLFVVLLFLSYRMIEPFFANAIYNFERRGLESVRTQMWADYLGKTIESPKFVLFGTPINGTPLLDWFSHNLHNSFIMLHAKYGLIALLMILYLIAGASIYYLKERNYLFLALLIATFFRMQFDYTNFNAQLDIILYFLMFYRYYD